MTTTEKIKKEFNGHQDVFSMLKDMHKQINAKMNHLGELNKQFRNHQQLSFLKTFSNVMDKMTQQLLEAQQKYRNIDMEIERDERCVRLEKQIHFFRQQCLVLTQQLQKRKLQIQKLRDANDFLKQQNETLHANILKKSQHRNSFIKKIQNNISIPNTPNAAQKFIVNTPPAMKHSKFQIFNKPFVTTTKLQNEVIQRKKDDEVLEDLIKNLKSNQPQIGINLLKEFIKKELRTKKQTKLSIRNKSQKVELTKQNNQLYQLWEDCVKEAKSKDLISKFLVRETKLKILSKFLSAERFIQYLNRQISGRKCCNNWNCYNNLRESEKTDSMQMDMRAGTAIESSRKIKYGKSNRIHKLIENYFN